uniref:Uncharacterized protein n=1 Tax=Panagrolaimus sp. PS1159 TaxID=55785 RepID=A0AC35FGM4_9BILA
MNHYIFDKEGYHKYFNCSFYDIDLIPSNERKDPYFGIFMIVGSIFFEFIYLPVIIVLWQPSLQKESCYKLMSFIAIIDVIAILLNGFLTGIFSILGVVYCSCPQFMLIAGFFAYAAWLSESDLAIILAFNRCLFMLYPHKCEQLFKNSRIYYWIVAALGHAFIVCITTGPLTYNSLYGVWLFNPHFGYPQPDFEFGNFWHPIQNIAVPFSLAFFYIIFAVTIIQKMMYQENQRSYSQSQKGVFIQVFIVAMLNFVISLLYVYEQYFPTPKYLTRFSQAGWMCIHGVPGVVYLTMNKSVRNRSIQLFKKYWKPNATAPLPTLSENVSTTTRSKFLSKNL